MIIWLASYPRSGNTFFRILINRVFNMKTYSVYDDKGDIAADQKTAEVVGHQSFPKGFDLQQAREADELYLIKTHELPEPGLSDPVIYLLRDGRESTLSYRKYLNEFYAAPVDLLDVIRGDVFAGSWGQHVRAWMPATRAKTLLVRFEDLVASPQTHLESIAQFIGRDPGEQTIPSFDELKAINSRFFRRGRTDSWKEEFSAQEQLAFWLRNYREMLEYGYTDAMPELFHSPEQAESLAWLVENERNYAENKLRNAVYATLAPRPSGPVNPSVAATSASEATLAGADNIASEHVPEDDAASAPSGGEAAGAETTVAAAVDVHTLNADGEALYLQGALDAAKEKFEAALAVDPGYATAYNNLMVLHWDQGEVEQSLLILEAGLQHAPNDRDLLTNGASLLHALGQQDAADALAARLAEEQPPAPTSSAHATAEPSAVIAAPAASAVSKPETATTAPSAGVATVSRLSDAMRDNESCGEIVIATSIAPKGIEKQQRAVTSWQRLGFTVVSLNTEAEITELKAHFQDVEFVKVTRNGKMLAGKPYVFIDDVLDYLAGRTDSKVCGIVNSDIILNTDQGFYNYLCREAPGSLVYGSRVDVRNADDDDGDVYHRGFDFFFFGREIIRKLPRTDFMLGVPWWDYWVPIGYQLAGVPIKRLDSRIALHVWHHTNYSQEVLIRFAHVFVDCCKAAPFVHLYTQCVAEEFGQACYSVLSDAALDYIARNTAKHLLPDSGAVTPGQGVMPGPKVSAIVSTYRSAAFIGECLEDLVRQTIAEQIEIVIIDAASPEDEQSIVRDYQTRYPQVTIRYHRTPERIGVYAAWNMAAKMARGDYLITCSTNDRLRLDACEMLARTLDENPEVALVYGNSFLTKVPHERFDAATLCSLYIWPEYRYDDLLNRCMIGPHPMWRRSVHDEVGYFDEGYVAMGDQEFWLRIGKTHMMKNIPDFTGLYYVSETSLTGNADVVARETNRLRAHVQMHDCYTKWREMAERRRIDRALDTTQYPALHVVILAPPGQLELLEDTLNDVGLQNYENLQVTIVADQSLPDANAVACEGLRWLAYRSVMDIPRLIHQTTSTVEAEWVCLVEAGDRLEASAFQDVGAYILRNPDWQLIYTDEDQLETGAEYAEPRFKPAFNLTLLRETPYIGNLVFVRNSVCRALRGITTMALWRASDLALRVADQYGARGVGHVARVLLHRRPANDFAWGVGAEVHEYKQAVELHLQRRGLTQSGTALPKLSIVLNSLGNANERTVMLRNLIAKTVYPDYEVLVVEPAGADSIFPLADLPAARKVDVPGKSPGDDLNAAAQAAQGEFLVFLDGRCMALQADWLQRLLAQALEQDVGIVSARLVTKNKTLIDGGVILGLGTRCVGARMNVGVHMQESGYMGRAHYAQELSAVTSLCMLVRREAYASVDGFTADLTTGLYRDVDFCLRAQDKGWRIVWTPAATLMYLGDDIGADRPPRKKEILDAENGRMLDTWFKRLVNDPSFNRNLSHLHQNYQMELNTVPAWDAEIDAEPRILGFGVGSYGSWQYRGAQPLAALNESGRARCTLGPFSEKNKIALPTPVDIERMRPHTLLMHNTLHDDYLMALESYKRRNDVQVVFGQDDLMFALPPKNPFSKTIYKDIKKRIRKCIALSDQVLVTTAPLADAMREFTDRVRVLPNYLRSAVWGDLVSLRRQGDKPRVGWAGAQQHGGDLELLLEVVKATAAEVDWVFFGMCPAALRPYVREIHDAVPFEDYPRKLASLNLDLAVAPLERNRFNEAKSNLRLLEYGILGWPTIASDIHPYQQGPICRVPNNPAAWIKAIRERVHDLDALAREGDLLREWVAAGWMLEDHLDDWLAVLAPDIQGRVLPAYGVDRITA